jgi:hypothetical protein
MKRACIFDIISTRSSSDIPPAKSVSRRKREARNTAMKSMAHCCHPSCCLSHLLRRTNELQGATMQKRRAKQYSEQKLGGGGGGESNRGQRGGRSCRNRTEIHAFGHTNTPLPQPSVDALRLLLFLLRKKETDGSKGGICQTYLKS